MLRVLHVSPGPFPVPGDTVRLRDDSITRVAEFITANEVRDEKGRVLVIMRDFTRAADWCLQ